MKERKLSDDEQAELDELIAGGLEMLGNVVPFPADADDSAEVVRSIRAFVDAVRSGKAPRYLGDVEKIAYRVGALWGDEVRRTLGWHWVMLDEGRGHQPLLGLVASDRATAIRPQLYLYRMLMEPKRDNTAALLFDMLRAGDRPGDPKSYTLVD